MSQSENVPVLGEALLFLPGAGEEKRHWLQVLVNSYRRDPLFPFTQEEAHLVTDALLATDEALREAQREIEHLRQVCGITATDTSAGVLTLIRRVEAAEQALQEHQETFKRNLRAGTEELRASLQESRREVEQLETKLGLIENFCESHLPLASTKSEVVARRILWAIRESDDDPPHPDRVALEPEPEGGER